MRSRVSRRWTTTGLLALLVMCLVPAMASATGISLNRSPAPPQAVQRGAVQQLDFSITYATIADRWTLAITDPLGMKVYGTEQSVAGQASPINGNVTYTPASNAVVGRYRGQLDFYSTPGALESSALVTFDVADQLGTLQVLKFEDTNGNGVRDAGEPGVPGWTFRLVNPQGNGSVVVTGPDGTATITGVPAGNWQVAEVTEPGWSPVAAAAGAITVPVNGIATFAAANARPAPICGTVYRDANENGVLDPGETGYAGATLTLNGTRGTGAAVPAAAAVSGPDGAYCFNDLMPGTFRVTVTVPNGLRATSPRTIANIQVRSGVGSSNNNFGLNAGSGTTQGGPAPDVRINKAGPATAEREGVFNYRISVRNRSAFTAKNVEVTDLVPVQLTLVSIPKGATMRNGVVTWPVGNLRPNQLKVLTMRVRVNPTVTGTIINKATVTADGLPPRSDTARTRVKGPAPTPRTGGVTG